MRIGVNAHNSQSWTSAAMFTDMRLQFDRWGTDPSPWAGTVPVNASGYPTVPAATWTSAFGYPTGDYLFRWKGTATWQASGKGWFVTEPAKAADGYSERVLRFNAVGSPDNLMLRVSGLDAADPLSDVQIRVPGEDPAFLLRRVYRDLLRPFSRAANGGGLRVMDLLGIVNNSDREWSDRVQTTDWNQAQEGRGPALEHAIRLANDAGCDLWTCLPYRASDDYVRQAAALYLAKLDPAARIAVEVGNEEWGFWGQPGQVYAQQQADADASLSGSGQARKGAWYGRRTKQVSDIFRDVWGDQFARVDFALTGYDDFAEAAMAAVGDLKAAHVAALGVDPYIGPADKFSGTPEEWFASLDAQIATQLPGAYAKEAARAKKYGIELWCYECGLTKSSGAADQHAEWRNLSDARMRSRVKAFLAAQEAAGVTRCLWYTLAGFWDKEDTWGLIEVPECPHTPRMEGVLDYLGLPIPPVSYSTTSAAPQTGGTSTVTVTTTASTTPATTTTVTATVTTTVTTTTGTTTGGGTVTPTLPTALRIDCGAIADPRPGYLPDQGFAGGTVDSQGPPGSIIHTERWGMSGYRLHVAPGSYVVTLTFAETYAGITAPGQRVFDVVLQAQATILNVDPFALAGGRDRPAVVGRAVTVGADGVLFIGFVAKVQQPQICAIEVTPVNPAPADDELAARSTCPRSDPTSRHP